MTPRERIMMSIHHKEPDRTPRGELVVEEAFLDRFYPGKAGAPYIEKMKTFVGEFGIDLITVQVDDDEDIKDLGRWTVETPHFIMALVDGIFWHSKDPISFQEFMLGIISADERVQTLINNKKRTALQLIQKCLDQGAHGIMIGDDIAYDRGSFVSPDDLRRWFLPGHQELVAAIKSRSGVAFLHSCGNLTGIMDLILSSGFDGLHSLAPSSGNDPLTLRQLTKGRLTLMGICEVDRLNPHEIKAIRERIVPQLAAGGGYILGSAEGLSMNTPVDSVRALYS